MKGVITRRGAFAAAAGGAVAAASTKLGVNTGYEAKAPEPYYGKPGAATPMEDPHWTARQLAKAKKIASGDFEDHHPTDGPQCPYRPLRSVSDAAKWVMRDQRARAMWRERQIQNALNAIAEYDKTGIFRGLF